MVAMVAFMDDIFASWGGSGGLSTALRVHEAEPLARDRGWMDRGEAADRRPAEPMQFGLFRNEAGERPYALFVPPGPSDEPRPLLLMLHGCRQTARSFARATRMNHWAARAGCIVVYPEQSSRANGSMCWNWFSEADQHRGAGEPAILAGLVEDIAGRFAVRRDAIFAAGLSAGAAEAAILGAAYPDLFAAIGVHSGLACGAASDLVSALVAMRRGGEDRGPALRSADGSSPRAPRAIVFHGDRDQTVHPLNGDQVVAQVLNGAAHRTLVARGAVAGGHDWTCSRHVDDAGRVLAESWTIHGGGHAWSGGAAGEPFSDPMGPDASEAMLAFFLGAQAPALPGNQPAARALSG